MANNKNINKTIIIAVDGTAASGKGTLAKKIAHHYNFAYLDTGKIYRAVAYLMLGDSHPPSPPISDEDLAIYHARKLATMDDPSPLLSLPELGMDKYGNQASKIATIPELRTSLKEFQQNFARTPHANFKGAVLDGRDIGTVICPDADVKLYISASPEIRAQRRHKELSAQKDAPPLADIIADIKARDERDSKRAIAPLEMANDAYNIDTSNMTSAQVFETARAHIDNRL